MTEFLNFRVFEEKGRTSQEEYDADMKELDELRLRLGEKTDIEKYRGSHGKVYKQPVTSTGYTTIPVLRFLLGLPLSNLVLSYIHALRPSAIRVSGGAIKTDSEPWRVTVFVDKEDRVTGIIQEVQVLYGCGNDIDMCLHPLRHPEPDSKIVELNKKLAEASKQHMLYPKP